MYPKILTLVGLMVVIMPGPLAVEKTLSRKVSPYATVVVTENDQGLRFLWFVGHPAPQSVVKVGDPDHVQYEYIRAMAVALALVKEPNRVLVVGLGGGTLPGLLHKHYPEMTIDVVDIDPVVVEMARKYFGFREDAFMHVAIADGRRFIEKCKEPYDIIFLDAYGTNNIPYDLTTKEFLQAVRRALGPQGVVAANIWSSSYNRLFGEMLRTYQEVFDDLSLIDLRDNTSQIFLARPCLGSVNRADLAGRASRLSKEKRLRFDLGGYVWWGFRQANAKNSRVPVLLDKDKRRSQGGSICPHRRRSDSIDVHSSTILVAATVCLRIMSHDSPDGRHGLC